MFSENKRGLRRAKREAVTLDVFDASFPHNQDASGK